MLRACLRGAKATARKTPFNSSIQHRQYSAGNTSSAAKIAAASLITAVGGIGGTILYAKWDHKFRSAVENNVPYAEWLLDVTLGPAPDHNLSKKQVEFRQPASMMELSKTKPEKKMEATEKPQQSLEEASIEATHIISAMSEVQSMPAPHDTEAAVVHGSEQCHECKATSETAETYPATEKALAPEPLKERPMEEVAARLAEQDKAEKEIVENISANLEESLSNSANATLSAIGAQEAALQAISLHTLKLKEAMETEVPSQEKSSQWKDLEAALNNRTGAINDAHTALVNARKALDCLKAVIDKSKGLKVAAARPLVLAAEENLHKMVVDLDKVVSKVQAAESEAKVVSQYSELVNEAKLQFQREVSSLTPEIQANWKGLTGKLSVDDLNALIAHAHRRIDQLNKELAEQRVREQIHIEAALEQQKLEHQVALETSVDSALQHVKVEARLEQDRKISMFQIQIKCFCT